MKIAFITYTFPPQIGGMQNWSHQMAEAYGLAGHKVDVYHLVRGFSNHHSELYLYNPVYIDKITDQSNVPVQYYSFKLFFVTVFFLIKNLKKLSTYDIWQITVGEPQLLRILVTLLSNLTKVTLIAASGNVIFRSRYSSFTRHFKYFLAKFVLSKANMILVDGIDIKKECVEHDIPSDKIRICYAGVDTNLFKPRKNIDQFANFISSRSPSFKHDKKTILYSCRFSWENAPDVFLEIVSGIKNAHVIMAGNGPMMDSLRMQAEALDLNVHFIGAVPYEHLPILFSNANVCLLPYSRYIGGISQVIPLSMSCGAIVVTTNIGDNRALIKNGLNGFLAPEKDFDGMRVLLSDILNDKTDNKSISKNARETIVNQWSIECRNKEYAELLNTLQNKT